MTVRDVVGRSSWPRGEAAFLEPACGGGNFLVAILARKLDRIGAAHESGTLPAGPGIDAIQFHALEALASIYAMDISPDNVACRTCGPCSSPIPLWAFSSSS